MVTFARCRRRLVAVAGSGLLAAAVAAQDVPPPRPTLSDADNFFIEYSRAAGFAARGDRETAALAMEAVRRQVTTSPWTELAQVKCNELMERHDATEALAGQELVLHRLESELYYQTADAAPLRQALRAMTTRGIRRVRRQRIETGLQQYRRLFDQYPDALALLVTHHILEPADLRGPGDRPFAYLPRALSPTRQRYVSYDLELVPAEPFVAPAPRIASTTRIGNAPPHYAALVQLRPRTDPVQVEVGEWLDGKYVAIITARGAILCTPDQVLIRPVTR